MHCLAGLLPVPGVRTSCRACGTEGRAPRLSLASPRGCWYQQRAPCDLLPLHAVAVNPPRLMNPHSSACASLGRGPAAAARTIPETVTYLSHCAPPVDLCPQVDLAAACIAARAALAQGRDADAFKAAQAVSLGCIACDSCTAAALARECGVLCGGCACLGAAAAAAASLAKAEPQRHHAWNTRVPFPCACMPVHLHAPRAVHGNMLPHGHSAPRSPPAQCMEVARRSFTAPGAEDRRWQVGCRWGCAASRPSDCSHL